METPVEDSRDAIREFCEHYGLSPRESEVCEMWLTGHGLKYIQENLFISEATVKTHVRNIYRKCDTHNRAEILALYEAGIRKIKASRVPACSNLDVGASQRYFNGNGHSARKKRSPQAFPTSGHACGLLFESEI